MTDKDVSDFFLSDVDDELTLEDDGVIRPPVVVPPAPAQASMPSAPDPSAPAFTAISGPPNGQTEAVAPVAEDISEPVTDVEVAEPASPAIEAESVASPPGDRDLRVPSREVRLATALRRLMEESQDIEAAALVSLDGFAMASALPEGMHEDRVGAMSAAILGLGERAAVELGKGKLSQVFIEGDGGYVLLIAAGDRAVLTCLADEDAKLGLVLYDMRLAAQSIGEILG